MIWGMMALGSAALLGLVLGARRAGERTPYSTYSTAARGSAPMPPARWWEDPALPGPVSQEWLTEHDYDRSGDGA